MQNLDVNKTAAAWAFLSRTELYSRLIESIYLFLVNLLALLVGLDGIR